MAKFRPIPIHSAADKAIDRAGADWELVADPRAAPLDPSRVRGWPAVGSGRAGAIAGTIPHRAFEN
jgi:hypothetical protein